MMRFGVGTRRTSARSSSSSSSSSNGGGKSSPCGRARGATELKEAILKVIADTKPGSERPMSTNEMSRIALEMGLPEEEARKVPTQIRRGGPLHKEWKAAFTSGRFRQKNGRPSRSESSGESMQFSSESSGGSSVQFSSGSSDTYPDDYLMRFQFEPGGGEHGRRGGGAAAEEKDEEAAAVHDGVLSMDEDEMFDSLNLDDPGLIDDLLHYTKGNHK